MRAWEGFELDLLAQAIDVGFERVRRDVGVVAPHLGEQHVAADDLLPGPVEKAQDRGLLLGELELRALLADEELRARPECVGADLEDRVLARFVLPELRPDAGEEHGELERLDDVIVGAGLEPEHRVGVRDLRRQHDDRAAEAVAAHDLDRLASVHVGQPDIHDGKIDAVAFGLVDGRCGGVGAQDLELVIERELLGERVPQVRVVVDDEKPVRVRHRIPVRCAAGTSLGSEKPSKGHASSGR